MRETTVQAGDATVLADNKEEDFPPADLEWPKFRQSKSYQLNGYLILIRTRFRLGGLSLNSPYRSPAGTQKGIW